MNPFVTMFEARSMEYVPRPRAELPLGSGIRRPVTGWKPSLIAVSCCRMPPFPAAAGGGPGQQSIIRCEVRLSAKHPHVSHQVTVPEVIRRCLLPVPTLSTMASAAMRLTALLFVLSHFDVASFAQDVDLVLQVEQSQLFPERANSMLCPPLLAGTTGLTCLGVRFFLPSTPARRSSLILCAATAFHLAASESRYG